MKILLPVDPTHLADAPVAFSVRTAKRLSAELRILGVASPDQAREKSKRTGLGPDGEAPPAGDASGNADVMLRRMAVGRPTSTLIETRDQALSTLRSEVQERLETMGVEAGATASQVDVLLQPNPPAVIASYVEEHGVDLLIMRTHRHDGLRRLGLGSVTEAVVRTVKIPALLLGPSFVGGAGFEYDELALCVDGSTKAEQMLPVAAWVRNLGMRVTVITAIPAGHATDRSAEQTHYVRGLAAILETRGVSAGSALVAGPNPAVAIADYVTARPTCLPALVTHGRAGLSRILQGSIAMELVQRSPSPVLVMHAVAEAAAAR
jgi:nucleotide-binding universal stress UspA family protein